MAPLPAGHPEIPPEVSVDALVAIVTVHDSDAVKANRHTDYIKTQILSQRPGRVTRGSVEGCHVFLHNTDGQTRYTFGRAGPSTKDDESQRRDIYLTDKQADVRHLCLLPVKTSNAWRMQSISKVEAIVNGVPIQSPSSRVRDDPECLPCAVYLRQGTINRITIKGLRVDVWLMKTVHEAYPMVPAPAEPIENEFAHRSEIWAQRDQFLLLDRVSAKSHRILHRFTGEVLTAKVFRDAPNRWELRTEEFRKFGKNKVDASIVRYQAQVSIDNIPAIITDTHTGMVSYAAIQPDIKDMHPGRRFLIAAKLQRRLFSALDFLHSNGIIHGSVTLDSVLVRPVADDISSILLVDYSTATSVSFGAESPRPAMLEDGRALMEIVEDCCNIWELRNKPLAEASSDEQLALLEYRARLHLNLMKRVFNDHYAKGGDKFSEKGRKLTLITEQKAFDLETVKIHRVNCAKMVGITACLPEDIDKMVQDWAQTAPPFKIGEMAWMNLSLGHSYLDNLANELRYERWDSTPREICARYKALDSAIEDSWQSVTVLKPLTFERRDGQFVHENVLIWIASCCEVFPDWREAMQAEFRRCIGSREDLIGTTDLATLRDALRKHGNLPSSIKRTFEELLALKKDNTPAFHFLASHDVTVHAPSGMFNLTQLQHLASPDRFVSCVKDADARCDTFIEVRGEPSLQGSYAPLVLLPDFVRRLGLSLPQVPDTSVITPVHDPADFSQVPAGRIVVVRTGLIAFASLVRGWNQCCFHCPKIPDKAGVMTESAFFATYFGNMKIIPDFPQGTNRWARPEHWSKFKTAEEQEKAADLAQRVIAIPNRSSRTGQILQPFSRPGHLDARSVSSWRTSPSEADAPPLVRMLKNRERQRLQAQQPKKRNTVVEEDDTDSPSAKRQRNDSGAAGVSSKREKPELSDDRLNAMANRLAAMGDYDIELDASTANAAPKSVGVSAGPATSKAPSKRVTKLPYPIQEGFFNLENDWMVANKWIEDLEDYESDTENLPDKRQDAADFKFLQESLAATDITEEEPIDEEVLNRHRAAIQKEAEAKGLRRESFAEAKARRARAGTRKMSLFQSRGGASTAPQAQSRPQTPEPPIAPARAAAPSADRAAVSHTPAFESPTPMVAGWLSSVPVSRGTARRMGLTGDLTSETTSLPDTEGGPGVSDGTEKGEASLPDTVDPKAGGS